MIRASGLLSRIFGKAAFIPKNASPAAIRQIDLWYSEPKDNGDTEWGYIGRVAKNDDYPLGFDFDTIPGRSRKSFANNSFAIVSPKQAVNSKPSTEALSAASYYKPISPENTDSKIRRIGKKKKVKQRSKGWIWVQPWMENYMHRQCKMNRSLPSDENERTAEKTRSRPKKLYHAPNKDGRSSILSAADMKLLGKTMAAPKHSDQKKVLKRRLKRTIYSQPKKPIPKYQARILKEALGKTPWKLDGNPRSKKKRRIQSGATFSKNYWTSKAKMKRRQSGATFSKKHWTPKRKAHSRSIESPDNFTSTYHDRTSSVRRCGG